VKYMGGLWVVGWWLCCVVGCGLWVGGCVVLVLADSESTRNDTYNLHTPL
jgi:hypothetical protein